MLLSLSVFGQDSDKPYHSIFLIGDCGKDSLVHQNLRTLQYEMSRFPESSVIFLGDNIYQDGLSGAPGSEKRYRQKKKILTQIDVVKQHTGQVYFIPGNHDWKAGRWNGMQTMMDQAAFVEDALSKDSKIHNDQVYFPKTGLPGPESVKIKEKVRMIAVDTQWWLHGQFFHKIGKLDGKSKRETEQVFFKELDSLLALCQANGEWAVLAAHHPLFSNGHHGAAKQPLRFLINWTPFQIFGLIGLNRMLVQDIPQPRYKRMKKKFLAVLSKYPKVIFVSGHEHNLQYHRNGDDHFLVSGSGSKVSEIVQDKYPAVFMDDRFHGFMRLDLYENGRAECSVINGDQGKLETILHLE